MINYYYLSSSMKYEFYKSLQIIIIIVIIITITISMK